MNETDRLHQSWLLRKQLHDWLKHHPRSHMRDLWAAFPAVKRETVRKHIWVLVRTGSIATHGANNRTRYSAVGDAIYSEQDLRDKLRVTRSEGLEAHNNDNIARAWQQRRTIHAWICAHPYTPMAAIVAAFPAIVPSTVQSSVRVLCDMGNVRRHGASIASSYIAVTDEIYSLETVRDVLRQRGRAVGSLAGARHASNRIVREQREAEQAQIEAAKAASEPWKTTNNPEKHRPHPYQGGQFHSGSLNGRSTLAGLA